VRVCVGGGGVGGERVCLTILLRDPPLPSPFVLPYLVCVCVWEREYVCVCVVRECERESVRACVWVGRREEKRQCV